MRRWIAPFFTIWSAQAFSLVGSSLVQFALIWWLTTTSGSSMVLAQASLVGLLPQVFLSPLAGALVDRWSRRWIMIIADGGIALATLVLLLLFFTGRVQFWHVYVLLFIRSLGSAFHYPAMSASTSLMVPKDKLIRIQGANQVLYSAMSIVSAPLGALTLASLPMQGVLLIDVGTAILAILPLFFIAIPQPVQAPSREHSAAKPSIFQDMAAGLRYIWSWPGLMMILCMAWVLNLTLNPGFILMPILVKEHFLGDAYHLAAINSAFGIGMVAGGLILGIWGGFKRRIVTGFAGLLCQGVGTLLLGSLPSSGYWLAVVMMVFIGIANPITNGPVIAVIQAMVAPEMQGRVMSLVNSAASALMPIGIIIAGPIAERWGVQVWFITGGLITIGMAVSAFFIPAIMKIEEGRAMITEPR